jgi:hypothetical protein
MGAGMVGEGKRQEQGERSNSIRNVIPDQECCKMKPAEQAKRAQLLPARAPMPG